MDTQTLAFVNIRDHHRTMERVNRTAWMREAVRATEEMAALYESRHAGRLAVMAAAIRRLVSSQRGRLALARG